MAITEKSINVPMSKEMYAWVTAEAKRTDRSRAYVVRLAIAQYLEDRENRSSDPVKAKQSA